MTGTIRTGSLEDAVPPVRIGMLTPSSNTALEPLTTALLEPLAAEASVHFSRFRVTRIALDAGADAQFTPEPILAAADLLGDARCDVIAWNGTSASWRGFDTDAALCAAIERRVGCPATSAIVDLNLALERLGARTLGLVTPYTADVEAAIARNYASIGVEVVAARRADRSDNFSFAELTPAQVEEMCAEVASAGPDAVALICTNMRGPLVAPRVEAAFDLPVLDSISVTLWGALRRAGVPTAPLARSGRLFALD
jgi:maleate isomerase